jgi:hypothetical protein
MSSRGRGSRIGSKMKRMKKKYSELHTEEKLKRRNPIKDVPMNKSIKDEAAQLH